LSITII